MAQSEFTKIWEAGAAAKEKELLGQLLIAQNNSQGELFPEETPDLPVTPDTRLGDFQEQGGWMDKDKPWRDLNPRRKGYVPPRTRWSEGNKKRKAQDAQKQSILEKWRRDNGLDPDGNAFPPGWNLQIQGNPSFDIDPNKKPQTESQKRRADKLRDRKMRGGEGSGQAGDILEKLGESGVDLPNFIKNINPKDLLKILQLIPAAGGALLAPQLQIGQASPAPAPVWPGHKWPYPTPGQGPLPNPDIPTKIAELNPAQIKALEAIPSNLNKLPTSDRLKIIREVTSKVKGLA